VNKIEDYKKNGDYGMLEELAIKPLVPLILHVETEHFRVENRVFLVAVFLNQFNKVIFPIFLLVIVNLISLLLYC